MQSESQQPRSSDTRAVELRESDELVPSTDWRFVTIDQASAWLARRLHNRPIRKSDVTFMARQMREGLWRKNPQPILFEESTRRLVDGQHRLSAMIEADQPMWFRVDFVEDGIMPVLDTGRSRTAADVIALHDAEYTSGSYTSQAAAMKLLLAWERYRNPFTGQAGGSGRISNLEVVAALPRFPGLNRNVHRAQQLGYQGIPGGAGTWAGLLTRFETVDPELTDEFYDGMLHGAELHEESPILAVRNRLRASRTTRYALPRIEMAAIVVRGWNAFVKGEPRTVLHGRVKTDPSGKFTDASFPLVDGPRARAA